MLGWESAKQIVRKRSVNKRGAKGDEACAREGMSDMAGARNLLIINNGAHHAWRGNEEAIGKYLRSRDLKDSAVEATVWIGGLDRLNRSRGILKCYDFSATPFTPSGKQASEEALFGWIVSDFGLNDAIESGLAKTPRVVVRDDAVPEPVTYRSRLYHIYNDPDVKDDLSRAAEPHEPLPDLVTNAYYLLGYDWRETMRAWSAAGTPAPPVMITVCNRTETAARVKHAFDNKKIHIEELCDPEHTLHIDSKVLGEAESREESVAVAGVPADDTDEASGDGDATQPVHKQTKAERAELLRRMVDTVGRPGQPGGEVRNVISVGMLSEGWDARTVTHIMGLRAFTSQLLCEQVIGRGLRRTSYELKPGTTLFGPEYVNVFGVPFTFLPHEASETVAPAGDEAKVPVFPDSSKVQFQVTWPNVVRIDHEFRPRLSIDWSKVQPLQLDASHTAQVAELAPILEGKPDVTQVGRIELERLAQEFRTQRMIFEAARDVYEQMQPRWTGSREVLLAQLVILVSEFMRSDRITISPPLFYQDDLRRRLILTLNMSRVVQHIWDAIRLENTERLEPVFDRDHPMGSTGDMSTWYTEDPASAQPGPTSTFAFTTARESSDEYQLEHNEAVSAWVKNDHLGFEIFYVYRGAVRKYRPDFLVRLTNGDMLVLETKGQEPDEDRAKHRYLAEWVNAMNTHGGFGHWRWAVTLAPGDIKDVLLKAAAA